MRQPRPRQRTIPIRHPVLGCDLNGVLADANTPLLQRAKAHFGLAVQLADLTQYDSLSQRLVAYTGDARGVAQWLKKTVNSAEFILTLEPYPYTAYGWQKLLDLPVEPRIVTGHQATPETMEATRIWCQQHGFHVPVDYTTFKESWCIQTQARWFIEDSPKHIVKIAQTQTQILVPDRTYNSTPVLPNVTRYPSLFDMVPRIQDDLEYDGR
jgi:hypothetical protein